MSAPEEKPDDLGFDLPEPATLSRTRAFAVGAIALVVIGGAIVLGGLPRWRARKALATESTAAEGPLRVQVVTPKVVSSDRAVVLPGNVEPLEQTTLYPRTSGYVRAWKYDLGDAVKEGDVLAELDTPELDRELAQAKAALARAEASVVQAKATKSRADTELARAEALAKDGVGSKQELDQRRADALVGNANVKVAEAGVQAERANVARVAQLKAYAKIVAPFAGTVTSRSVERGALVTAGNTTPLFTIASSDVVRVFVRVPQNVAPGVKVDQPAKVMVREFAGRAFEGKIAHLAGALDPIGRTMLVEVRVPNADHTLLAGMYAQVSLTLPTPHRVLELPATALSTGAGGVRVATVDAKDVIHLVPVTIERDTGPTIELASGLSETDRVVKIAGAELTEGRAVVVVP